MVYLVRSLGTVWGVAISSAIVQTTLSARLPDALGDIPDKWKVRDLFFCLLSLGRYLFGLTRSYTPPGKRILIRLRL